MKKERILNINKKMVLTFCTTTLLVTVSYARPEGKKDGTPPKEAIEVCAEKEEGTQCTMNTPRGELTGKCMNTPDNKYFVCMPEDKRKEH